MPITTSTELILDTIQSVLPVNNHIEKPTRYHIFQSLIKHYSINTVYIETKTKSITTQQILKIKPTPQVNNQQTLIIIYLIEQIISFIISTRVS